MTAHNSDRQDLQVAFCKMQTRSPFTAWRGLATGQIGCGQWIRQLYGEKQVALGIDCGWLPGQSSLLKASRASRFSHKQSNSFPGLLIKLVTSGSAALLDLGGDVVLVGQRCSKFCFTQLFGRSTAPLRLAHPMKPSFLWQIRAVSARVASRTSLDALT